MVFFVAIVSPGPNILAVIGTSMGVGRTSGIALALGVAAGSFGWAMLTVVGLSALIASYAAALKSGRRRAMRDLRPSGASDRDGVRDPVPGSSDGTRLDRRRITT